MFDAFFFGHAAQQGEGRLLEHRHVHRHVFVRQASFGVGAGLARETGLVDVDDSVALILGLGELPLHCRQLLPLLLGVLLLWCLEPPILLLLDAVDRVDLPE